MILLGLCISLIIISVTTTYALKRVLLQAKREILSNVLGWVQTGLCILIVGIVADWGYILLHPETVESWVGAVGMNLIFAVVGWLVWSRLCKKFTPRSHDTLYAVGLLSVAMAGAQMRSGRVVDSLLEKLIAALPIYFGFITVRVGCSLPALSREVSSVRLNPESDLVHGIQLDLISTSRDLAQHQSRDLIFGTVVLMLGLLFYGLSLHEVRYPSVTSSNVDMWLGLWGCLLVVSLIQNRIVVNRIGKYRV